MTLYCCSATSLAQGFSNATRYRKVSQNENPGGVAEASWALSMQVVLLPRQVQGVDGGSHLASGRRHAR